MRHAPATSTELDHSSTLLMPARTHKTKHSTQRRVRIQQHSSAVQGGRRVGSATSYPRERVETQTNETPDAEGDNTDYRGSGSVDVVA